MQIRKPSHTTVVAYLALFAALGGTAIAARNDTGAKELKHLVVRRAERVVSPGEPGGPFSVTLRCNRGEQLISGAGGWDTRSSALGNHQPTVISTDVLTSKRRNGPAVGYQVIGSNPKGSPNTLVAQALCLPK